MVIKKKDKNIIIGIIIIAIALMSLNQFTAPRESFRYPAEFCVGSNNCYFHGLDPKYEQYKAWSYTAGNSAPKQGLANEFIAQQEADSYTCIKKDGIYDTMSETAGISVQQLIVMCECTLGIGNCPPPPPDECTTIGITCVNNDLISCIDTQMTTGSYLKETVDAACNTSQICDTSSESCLNIPADECDSTGYECEDNVLSLCSETVPYVAYQDITTITKETIDICAADEVCEIITNSCFKVIPEEEDIPEEDIPEEDIPEEDIPEEDIPEEDIPEEEEAVATTSKEEEIIDETLGTTTEEDITVEDEEEPEPEEEPDNLYIIVALIISAAFIFILLIKKR